LTGLGSFCLVSREKLPDWTGNLVNFADMDNDGMIDMFYVDRMSNDGLNLYIHYNKLENVDRAKNKNIIEDAFKVISEVCSATDRSASSLSDMFIPIN